MTLCRDGHKEVRYVQTAAELFIDGQAFQHIGYNHPFADVGQQDVFLHTAAIVDHKIISDALVFILIKNKRFIIKKIALLQNKH